MYPCLPRGPKLAARRTDRVPDDNAAPVRFRYGNTERQVLPKPRSPTRHLGHRCTWTGTAGLVDLALAELLPRPPSSAAGSTRDQTCCRRCEVRAPRAESPGGDLRADDKTPAQQAAKAFGQAYGGFSDGRREDRGGSGRAACVVRPSGQTLDLPAHDEPDRVEVRHRPPPDEAHQGPGSRAGELARAFKGIEAAQTRWRVVNALYLVAWAHRIHHRHRGARLHAARLCNG